MLTKQARFAGDAVKDDEMGGTCGTCGGEEKCLQRFGREKVKERDHLKEIDVDERMLLKCMGRHGLDSCGLG
jgi:hypothetical protein